MVVVENFSKFGKLSFDLPRFYPQKLVLCQELRKKIACDFELVFVMLKWLVLSTNHGIDQKTCTGELAFVTIC